MFETRPDGSSRWIRIDVLRRRFGDPGFIASGHTTQVLSGFVRHDTRGTPSEVPVPKNTIRDFDPELSIEEGYRLSEYYLTAESILSVLCGQHRVGPASDIWTPDTQNLTVNFVPFKKFLIAMFTIGLNLAQETKKRKCQKPFAAN